MSVVILAFLLALRLSALQAARRSSQPRLLPVVSGLCRAGRQSWSSDYGMLRGVWSFIAASVITNATRDIGAPQGTRYLASPLHFRSLHKKFIAYQALKFKPSST
ncbi:hypothetical protein B0I37DRAFT_357033 [Chaetomium sp. MPI-CAGE-AT-0009]|nr:hypothetical protein B0I37DRAFT_357033 [Chaetomium sp. MPI-CAGE-AT-0009]